MGCDSGKMYNFGNDTQITVPQMIGSSTKIRKIGADEYLVTTRGSKMGSKPVNRIMTTDELTEKFRPNNFERCPHKDSFVRHCH